MNTCTCIHVATDGEGAAGSEGGGRGQRVNRWTACRVLASHLTTPAVPPPLGLSSILPAVRARLFQPANLVRPTGLLPDRSHTFTAPLCRFPRVLPRSLLNLWHAILVTHDLSQVTVISIELKCGSRRLISSVDSEATLFIINQDSFYLSEHLLIFIQFFQNIF